MLKHGLIPVGYEVAHNCPNGDNKLCCNTRHFLLLTVAQHRAEQAGKKQYPAHKVYLPLSLIEEMRAYYQEVGSINAVERKFQRSPGVVRDALRGNYKRHQLPDITIKPQRSATQ